jgi:hypothetical protein
MIRRAEEEIKRAEKEYSEQKYSHYEVSFIKIRRGIAYLGIVFPIIFLVSSFVFRRTEFQPTISHYYCAIGGELERNLFVGVLITIGIFLFLYMGYSAIEDWILNAAGLCAFGIALSPTGYCLGIEDQRLTFHGVCAAIFFLCIAYVCVFLARVTLSKEEDDDRKKRFITIYNIIGAVMAVTIGLAILGNSLFKEFFNQPFFRHLTFFIEAVGIWAFSAFWLVKTQEVNGNIPLHPVKRKNYLFKLIENRLGVNSKEPS